ncbi:4Fe-4S binding protein [Aquimarina sp. SS2-1]|uniref:4Fe-4S binding protein n=1 Tax=Aquimarina besae TaxID=3342247 RepID=UPI003671E8C4
MSNKLDHSMSLASPEPKGISIKQKIAVAIGFTGLFILVLALLNTNFPNQGVFLALSLVLITVGTIIFANDAYLTKLEGIKNDGVWLKSISSRGMLGWIAGVVLTGFYIVLYFYEGLLGAGANGDANTGLIGLFDPLSMLLKGKPASQWFVYGTLYTIAILAFGYKFILKYRHNRYQQLRTVSVMFFQLGFAFLIPEFMQALNYPYYDFKNMWPLNYYFFYDWNINGFLDSGSIGFLMLLFGIVSIFVISPFLTYKYGKRWYCSWVCGCGGLAETAGDSFRQLSSKKLSAWKFERWSIHTVLVFAVIMTVAVLYSYIGNNPDRSVFTRDQFIFGVIAFLSVLFAGIMFFKRQNLNKDAKFAAGAILITIVGILLLNHFSEGNQIFFIEDYNLQKAYGFAIGAVFSGVVGTGFYPILGNRVWCRFGCPMAAILGVQQRLFSKFRITTNGGQCISCGNCSTYCEMGIDVRSYAQKGENIVRSSCVGCGICSAVCPRGVLKLENDNLEGRISSNEILLGNDVDLMDYVNNK